MISSGPIYVTYPIVVAYVAFRFDPQCEAEADCCAKMMQEMEASGYCYTARTRTMCERKLFPSDRNIVNFNVLS
jgi:hypothetical protein